MVNSASSNNLTEWTRSQRIELAYEYRLKGQSESRVRIDFKQFIDLIPHNFLVYNLTNP